jgi:DNA-binding FrmR family transcriptional regulator
MAHINDNKQKIATRISRLKGQIASLENSLNGEVDCGAFLHHIASIRGAVDGLMLETLEGHIREHLSEVHEDSAHRQQDLEEVIHVVRTYLK